MLQSPSTLEDFKAAQLRLNLQSVDLTDAQFYKLCSDNPELRLELTAERELIIMSPTGSETGRRNSKINQRLANWSEQNGRGVCFDSSTGFTLPNGAKRSPDAAWVRREAWDFLSRDQQAEFAPLAPDFVIELRSPGDSLADLQAKMAEYIETGTLLGWLFDPFTRRAYVYRHGQATECIESPGPISGDPILPGFVFDPAEIW